MADRPIVTLFRNDGTNFPRIPSIDITPRGTLLAFTSLRKGNVGDWGHDTDVLLRRSADGGVTWSDAQTIMSVPGVDIHSGPVVVDRRCGRVLKFGRYRPADCPGPGYAAEHFDELLARGAGDYVVESDDEGLTWSSPRKVEIDYPGARSRQGIGNGVHGIQLPSGRLLAQAGYQTDRVFDGSHVNDHGCLVASDDGGRSWQVIGTMPGHTVREFGMARCRDGRLYINMRIQGGSCRGGLWSDDGTTFSDVTLHDDLPDPQCHAGLTRLDTGEFVLTNAAVANTSGGYQPGARRNLTAHLSADDGRTWPKHIPLHDGPAGYSDVVADTDGAVHCIYESGENTYNERVDYLRFEV